MRGLGPWFYVCDDILVCNCYCIYSYSFASYIVFISILGFCFHWLLVLIGIFWLQHLCHLFLKIMFPIWSKKHNDMEKSVVLHVMEVSGAVFISILAPVIYLAVSKYTVIRFPPVLCFPSRKVIFYTVCLPLCVILGSGSILFIIIFWTLVKVSLVFVFHLCNWMMFLKI